MNDAKKITVDVSTLLLKEAQAVTGEGISETVRRGLQLLAASRAYAKAKTLRGKVKFAKSAGELREDRE